MKLKELGVLLTTATRTFGSLAIGGLEGQAKPLKQGEASAVETMVGSSLRDMQSQYESEAALTAPLRGEVEQTSFSRPLQASDPSGDVMRVIRADDGNLHYMLGDVEGHGIEAGADSVKIHSALDGSNIAAKLAGKTASDGLSVIDESLPASERTLAIQAR